MALQCQLPTLIMNNLVLQYLVRLINRIPTYACYIVMVICRIFQLSSECSAVAGHALASLVCAILYFLVYLEQMYICPHWCSVYNQLLGFPSPSSLNNFVINSCVFFNSLLWEYLWFLLEYAMIMDTSFYSGSIFRFLFLMGIIGANYSGYFLCTLFFSY